MIYQYQAKLWRVIDGDTADLFIDNGRHEYALDRFRLFGPDTYEMHDRDPAKRVLAQQGRDFAATWFTAADPHYGNDSPAIGTVHEVVDSWLHWWPLSIETFKSDSFGRYLYTVTRTIDGARLIADLLNSGYAVPWVRSTSA